MSESKSSKRMLAAIEQQRAALELRKTGMSFPAIAAKLGYGGPAGAYRAVMSAIKRTLQEPADEVRKLELERLDVMLEKTWRWAIELDEPKAIDRVLSIMERRARYLGLDAPTKIAPTSPDGLREWLSGFADADIDREIITIVDGARQKAAGASAHGAALPVDDASSS